MNRGFIGALCFGAAAAFLSGCGNGQSPSEGMSAMHGPLGSLERLGERRPTKFPGSSGDLLYTSGTNGNVYIFTFPSGKSVGKLTGFAGGLGLCTDKGGNVFIPSLHHSDSSSTIYEYPHGGSAPIASLSDPGSAYGCAVDPSTGDLAVTNDGDDTNPYGDQYGSVALYHNAQGSPTMYYPSGLKALLSGYDGSGSLYLTAGIGSPPKVELVRLDTGSGSFQPITLNAKISYSTYFLPFAQWDGSHLTVSSNARYKKPVFVYQLNISGNTATVVGTTALESNKNRHVGQSWIDGKTIVGNVIVRGQNNVALWPYPQGGKPSGQIRDVLPNDLGHLNGIVVSHGGQ